MAVKITPQIVSRLPKPLWNLIISTSDSNFSVCKVSIRICSILSACSRKYCLVKPPCSSKYLFVMALASKNTSKLCVSILRICVITISSAVVMIFLSKKYTISSSWSGYTSFQMVCEWIGLSDLLSIRYLNIVSIASCCGISFLSVIGLVLTFSGLAKFAKRWLVRSGKLRQTRVISWLDCLTQMPNRSTKEKIKIKKSVGKYV